jgi:hypothetical protein
MAFKLKVIGRTVPHNNCVRSSFILILPLYVSALNDHLQEKYTIFLGSYLTTTDLLFRVISLICACFLQILPSSI